MKRLALFFSFLAAVAWAAPQQKTPDATQRPSFWPSYGNDRGVSPVGVIPSAILHDGARNRDIEVSIEYPTRGTGPFPIIIFSPGYGGSSHGYEGLISYWTSYGYVCIRPKHADADALRDTMNDLLSMRRDDRQNRNDRHPRTGNADTQAKARPNPAEMIWEKEREPQWRDRVRDVVLVLDSLDDLEKNYPELAGKMDHARIGVGGHSYGAFTAMLSAGTKTFSNPPLSLGDKRVKAIIAMSPQGVSTMRGLNADSWKDLKVPAMFMTGSRDYAANETEGPDWRKTAYDDSPAGDKFLVMIRGAGHMTFTGVATGLGEQFNVPSQAPIIDQRTGQTLNPGAAPTTGSAAISDRDAFGSIRSVSLMFWDGYLKDKKTAKELLDPTKFAGSVELSKK